MVNLYKLLNVLEQGMTLFQLNKWKTEGLWYPITQYKKESDEIQVVTNLFPRTNRISYSTFWELSGGIRRLEQVSRGKPMENLSITETGLYKETRYLREELLYTINTNTY